MRFSAVYRVGGLNLYRFLPRKRAGGHARKIAVSNGAEIFTVVYIGTTEGANLSFGDVSAVLRKRALIVPLGLLMRLPYKRQ